MAAATPASGSGGGGAYSCETAEQTREWMEAVAAFLRSHRRLLEAHVVNFFKDRLWEMVDAEWMECLRGEPVESLLMLPSGCVQENWPSSLRDFILTARSLALSREQKSPRSLLPDMHVASINTVLAQGMNSKKKHEIETLAGMVHAITKSSGAHTVIDVGSGQGYLAQALSFEYQLPVVAIDASSHHASVTNTRAERIKKHYAAKCVGKQQPKVPRTVTCHVLSSDTLAAVTLDACQDDHVPECKNCSGTSPQTEEPNHIIPSLVLAGLHACGDLSVNMLRVFMSCEQVKALISVGCCYNLLSEGCHEDTKTCPGFPMSKAARLSNLVLGKSIRDLACQSAERWRSLTKDIAVQNFDIHAFRAAFQMVLDKYFPEVSRLSPSIGRQGKALRRQRLRKVMESRMAEEKIDDLSYSAQTEKIVTKYGTLSTDNFNPELSTGDTYSASGSVDSAVFQAAVVADDINVDTFHKFTLFKDFTMSGLGRLGCDFVEDITLLEIWKDVQPFTEFIGPFWCLRTALGPLVETYILLDRLLFLQEQGGVVEASLFPLFNPTMSPRNMAIIAWKLSANPSKV
ncbi:hypothetical protein GUJ93_ZPchr0012g20860 [Zizania palustris]|uniref:Methyltransferase domain-containing protein n=1 Tax=Zizania palustris TaxID=103762 RepID=A0A8J6BQA7_ZIZPA|nr:hypothetical protein GUJ93_ZPchr0012g20860 [Zizania palustris]